MLIDFNEHKRWIGITILLSILYYMYIYDIIYYNIKLANVKRHSGFSYPNISGQVANRRRRRPL